MTRLLQRTTLILFLTLPGTFSVFAQNFGTAQTTGSLQSPALNEVSGLAASRRNPGVLWAHNDSGGAPAVYAISRQGALLGTFTLGGLVNRDWEDIAIGPGPNLDQDYLYLGEIGDNSAVYPGCAIYRIPEPYVSTSAAPVTLTLTNTETLAFTYTGGPRDAEALMLDPLTRDLFVVTKRETNCEVYVLSYPQSTNSSPALSPILTLPFTQAVAGDISPSGRQIAIKTYLQSFWWPRSPTQSVAAALVQTPVSIPHVLSFSFPQNEAFTWADWDAGYFTLAEGIAAPVVFFTNLDGTVEADIDFDTLEDHWEWDNFGGLSLADATTDRDGDHMLDRDEFIAGTEPTNVLSFLNLAFEGLDSKGNFVLTWTGAGGRTYQVMTAPTPNQDYFPVYSNFVASSGALSITTVLPDSLTAFVRLEVSRQD